MEITAQQHSAIYRQLEVLHLQQHGMMEQQRAILQALKIFSVVYEPSSSAPTAVAPASSSSQLYYMTTSRAPPAYADDDLLRFSHARHESAIHWHQPRPHKSDELPPPLHRHPQKKEEDLEEANLTTTTTPDPLMMMMAAATTTTAAELARALEEGETLNTSVERVALSYL